LIDQLIKPIDKKQNLPNKILFLNFNYTNSIEFFVNGMTDSLRKKTNILYLHGQLNNQSNKMIFGYGDEQDENFNLLEKYDDCLKFVKGYKYLHTNTYKNFLNFIENDDYEVFTLGHSCNLSDKTMLSELFNNSRCKKIKILTYVKSNELDGLHSTNYNE